MSWEVCNRKNQRAASGELRFDDDIAAQLAQLAGEVFNALGILDVIPADLEENIGLLLEVIDDLLQNLAVYVVAFARA